ncbi:MAG: radical SAM protein [Planctomycetes bacterium]|nr:radical SAM protein [Planctomycetota bacterium]
MGAGYEIFEGRIATWALEAHVADHCNLRCANCCTLSPSLAPRLLSAADLARDLALLRPVLAPQVFKLTGGEPLLHPGLAELAGVARASGIAPEISVTTNGHLATRADPALWRAIDRMTLSLYPSAPLPPATLEFIRAHCEQHGIALRLKPAPAFQVMDAPLPHADATQVFSDCWLRHRCHMVRDGRFYLCTRPPHLADLHDETALHDDGVALPGPGLLPRLHGYLTRQEALASCRLCMGAGGAAQQHRQLAPQGPRNA